MSDIQQIFREQLRRRMLELRKKHPVKNKTDPVEISTVVDTISSRLLEIEDSGSESDTSEDELSSSTEFSSAQSEDELDTKQSTLRRASTSKDLLPPVRPERGSFRKTKESSATENGSINLIVPTTSVENLSEIEIIETPEDRKAGSEKDTSNDSSVLLGVPGTSTENLAAEEGNPNATLTNRLYGTKQRGRLWRRMYMLVEMAACDIFNVKSEEALKHKVEELEVKVKNNIQERKSKVQQVNM